MQKRRYCSRHQPWQHCIRSSPRPLVATVPCIRVVANSHTSAASTNRSHAVMRRAMACRAVKQNHNRESTQNTTHIDGASENKTNIRQTNNSLCRSVVAIAAANRGVTARVRPAGHWSPSCHASASQQQPDKSQRQQTAATP